MQTPKGEISDSLLLLPTTRPVKEDSECRAPKVYALVRIG